MKPDSLRPGQPRILPEQSGTVLKRDPWEDPFKKEISSSLFFFLFV